MNIAKYKGSIRDLTACGVCGYKFKQEDLDIKNVKSSAFVTNSVETWRNWKYYIVCPECGTYIFLQCPDLKKKYIR